MRQLRGQLDRLRNGALRGSVRLRGRECLNMKPQAGRSEAEGPRPVTFWSASFALSCLQGFAAGYAIRDASTPELSGLEPTDEGGIEER
jgi:hypothetical protein